MTTAIQTREELLLQQFERERQSFSSGVQRLRRKSSLCTFQQRFLSDYLDPLTCAITRKKETIGKQRTRAQLADFPIAALDEESMAFITLMTLLHSMSTRTKRFGTAVNSSSPTLRATAMKIGQHCRDQYFLEYEQACASSSVEPIVDTRAKVVLLSRQSNKWNAMTRTEEILDNMKDPTWWSLARQIALGGTLLELAMDTTGLFTKNLKCLGMDLEKKTAILVLTQLGQEWLSMRQAERRDRLHHAGTLAVPINQPTIVEPKPWKELRNGGYFKTPSILVKRNNENFISDDLYDFEQIPEVLDAVNSLQNTSWRVNERLFDIYRAYWDRYDCRDLLFLHADAEQCAEAQLAVETKIDTCQSLVGRSFYFPFQLDFRGRIYPVPQVINNQADDVTRALIEFAQPEPVDNNSEFWTAIHVANVYGKDKLTLDERYLWCYDNRQHIESLVQDPARQLDFWHGAAEPWAFLAATFAWTDIRKGSRYSNLPIHADGRYNGLQHLSAMGRDEDSARAVNVVATNKPEDIYQRVAEKLAEIIARDDSPWANYWNGKIDRSIVKKPVMTTPYGVTPEGIKRQMKLAARQHAPTTQALIYLRDKARIALSEAMSGPTAVKEWLQLVARILAKEDQPLIWTAPSGFRVMQDYRKPLFKRLTTKTFTVRYFLPVSEDRPINRRKQELGVIANFVHSMDAAHLVKVVNKLNSEGVSHVSVIHDSFGVHARHVQTMNKVIREEFRDIYKKPILDLFLWEQIDRTGIDLPRFDAYGSLDIDDVLDSDYFFS